MRQFWFLFSIGIFAVGLGGCGSEPEETAATPSPTSSPATSPAAVASPTPNATPTPGQVPPFQNPVVKQQSNVAAGLIQSTNPEERLRLLGRPSTAIPTAPLTTTAPSALSIDPFAVLPPSIVQTAPEVGEAPTVPEQVTRAVPDLPKLTVSEAPIRWVSASATPRPNNGVATPGRPATPRPNNGVATPRKPATTRGTGVATPGRPATTRGTGVTTSKPQLVGPGRSVPTLPSFPIAQVPDLPALPNTPTPPSWRDPNPPPPPPVATQPFVPPPPSTDLARGMEVTGVLQVGNQTKIILKAPAEPTTRYVNVGQLVSNGQVLVKRVKFDTGGEPIVIFEQNGIEIAKSVGAIPPADPKINNVSLGSSVVHSG